MRKQFILLLLISILALAACQGNQEAEPTLPVDAESSSSEENSNEPAPEAEVETVFGTGCTVVSQQSEPSAEGDPLLKVSETDWVRGPEDAVVTIIEYGDFQCPYCAQLEPVLKQLEDEYPEGLRIIYRHFPVIGKPDELIHDKAGLAVQAAEAAGLQGQFWPMHEMLFEKQPDWVDLSLEEFEPWLIQEAENLDLDVEQFSSDLVSDDLVDLAQNAWEGGLEIGLPGTPVLIINGEPYGGPIDSSSLTSIVKLELLAERQFTECPEMVIDPLNQYIATLETEKGDIVIELFPEEAPFAVNSFVFLVENDWFDNVTFHRVIPGFMAQAGDPTGTGFGGPGYAFEIEVSPKLKFDREGLLAMANAGPSSNGSQFFITYEATPHLDGQFTIFGEVLSGMDIVLDLTPRNPQQDPNLPPGDLILDVSIEEK